MPRQTGQIQTRLLLIRVFIVCYSDKHFVKDSHCGRGSVSNENNVLLDPEVLTDYPTQVLVLTVLVRMVDVLKYPTLVACIS